MSETTVEDVTEVPDPVSPWPEVGSVEKKDSTIAPASKEKTAFNTPKKEVPTPKEESGQRTWSGNPLHAVVDPFEEPDADPFSQNGFIGNDPFRSIPSTDRQPL